MRRWLYWGAQALAAAVVAVMVWRAIAQNWSAFRSLHVTLAPRPAWIALSVLTTFATYAVQIQSWRLVLRGWGERLGYGAAARIWLVANLGRYIPGKVWSVAGLIVLAQRAGVSAWAAGASAVAIQAIGVGGAVAVAAATTPNAESPLRLGAAALAAAVTIALLAWEGGLRWLARAAGLASELRALPLAAVAESTVLTFASWLTYGVAFWLLALGLGLPGSLSVTQAAGIFAVGYILGLLALFAPGGVGVRELVFIGLLTPQLGSGGAVALSVASRVLLTLCEAVAPVGTLVGLGKRKGDLGVRT